MNRITIMDISKRNEEPNARAVGTASHYCRTNLAVPSKTRRKKKSIAFENGTTKRMRGHGLRRVALSNTHTHRVFVLKPPQSDNSTTANDARIHRDGFRLGTRTRDDAYFFEGGGDLRDLLDRSVRLLCFAIRGCRNRKGKTTLTRKPYHQITKATRTDSCTILKYGHTVELSSS